MSEKHYPTEIELIDRNPKSRKAAMSSFCLGCEAGKRQDVKLCPTVGCAMWHLRSWSTKADNLIIIHELLGSKNALIREQAQRQLNLIQTGSFV